MISARASSRIAFAVAASLACFAFGANPFFPGAEGYGAAPSGSVPVAGWLSTASIYHVTTTADTINASTGKPAIGTLRGAFYDYTTPTSPKQQASNRIVVFDVGGVFQLTQGTLDIKTVNNIYVAGQTAPTPVTVYGNTTQVTKSNNTMTSNVVLRHMAFRRGAAVTGNTDSITFAGGSGAGDTIATNMILDHVSATWGTDENLSVTNNNTNVTVQYSIIADALRSDHAYGSLIRPQVDASVSFHHNLYANNSSRQARFGTYNAAKLTADFRNNVVYNWRDRASYTGGSSEPEQEFTDVNYVGNYLVAGAGTLTNPNRAFFVDKNVDSRVYQSGNFIDSDKLVNAGGVPNGADIGWTAFQVSTPVTDQTMTQMASAFATPSISTQAAADGYSQVVSHVGSFSWNRAAVDARIINNVLTNTGPADGIGAAAPNASELATMLATPTVARPAGFDTDGDGMPDAWEVQRGLNPSLASDGKLDYDNDQYTNVEEYINDLAAFPAPSVIEFTGTLNNRFAHSSNFDANPDPTAVSNWQPSRFDAVSIDGKSAVVDAIAQDAGSILIGSSSATAGSLAISGGSLFARQNIVVGSVAGGNALLTQSAGKLIVAGVIGGGVGALNQFNFTGGTLVANAIDATTLSSSTGPLGTFKQQGGTFAPGDTGVAGRTSVTGNLAIAAGTVAIDLGGTSAATSFQATSAAHDSITVTGNASLGGNIALALVGGYDPVPLQVHTIVSASSVSGNFGTVSGHQITANKWLAVTYDATSVKVTATLPGDGNVDGQVTFDDLLLIAQSYDQTNTTWASGDFNGNGATTFDDLLVIAQHYGGTLLADGSILTNATLAGQFESDWLLARSLAPEPTSLALLSAGALVRRRGP